MLVLVCTSLVIPFTRPVHSASKAPSSVVANFQAWVESVGEKHAEFEKAASRAAGRNMAYITGERVIVVDQSGAGDFTTINEAFAAVPLHNKVPVTIQVNPGIYVYPAQPDHCCIPNIMWFALQLEMNFSIGCQVVKYTWRC